VWLHEFVSLGGTQLVDFFALILGSIMYCISDQENEIRTAAKEANHSLLNLVRTTTKEFELGPLLRTLTMELLSPQVRLLSLLVLKSTSLSLQVTTRVASLSWINMLHEKDPLEMNRFISDLLPALLKTLSDSADEVVLINLQVLARICINEHQFQRVLNSLVQLFSHDRPLLEARGALIIRKLCTLLNSEKIFISLASIMTKTDPEFSSTMVQTLNLLLLTAPELSPLRKTLENSIRGGPEEHQQVFLTLFMCWSHNPVATFSLCLLSQAYDLSAELILKFANVDVTIGFLMQIDKLVQLLESPIFLKLRLQLLEVSMNYHADLLKSLYGLLMLLPQSQAYKTLSDRLSTVSSLKMNLIFPASESSDCGEATDEKYPFLPSIAIGDDDCSVSGEDSSLAPPIHYPKLLMHFETIQAKHCEYRLAAYEQKKILT
jgi:vacuole morphology and inheritance protein 14